MKNDGGSVIMNPRAIKYLLLVTPGIEEAIELLQTEKDKGLKSEYWQGIVDFFKHMNIEMNKEDAAREGRDE